jgi:hypothetical protein
MGAQKKYPSRGALPTVEDAAEAEAAGAKLKPFATSSMKRRRRVTEIFEASRRAGLSLTGLAGWLAKSFAPGTAASYAAVMATTIPTLKKNGKWTLLQRALRLSAARRGRPVQAPPASPTAVRMISQDPQVSATVRATTMILFVTASRHADLNFVRPRMWSDGTLELQFWGSKSDIFSRHCLRKWIRVPAETARDWYNRATTQNWASYGSMLEVMHRHALTVHSLRRGAITTLAEKYDAKSIAVLSGHADPQTRLGTIKYIEANPTQSAPKQSIEMATMLWEAVSRDRPMMNHMLPQIADQPQSARPVTRPAPTLFRAQAPSILLGSSPTRQRPTQETRTPQRPTRLEPESVILDPQDSQDRTSRHSPSTDTDEEWLSWGGHQPRLAMRLSTPAPTIQRAPRNATRLPTPTPGGGMTLRSGKRVGLPGSVNYGH